MKEFWKEGLFVAFAVVALLIVVDFLPIPVTKENLYSPLLMVFGIAILLLPVFPSILAGYWIRKKTSAKEYLVVPAIGALLGGVLLLGISVLQLVFSTDAVILSQMQEASSFGITLFEEMGVEEFRSFLITSSVIGLVFVAIINGALGLLGGFLGGYWFSRTKKQIN